MSHRGIAILPVVLGIAAALALAASTDEIIRRVFVPADNALRISLAGGGTIPSGSGTANVLSAWQSGGTSLGNSSPSITCDGTNCTAAGPVLVAPGTAALPGLASSSDSSDGWVMGDSTMTAFFDSADSITINAAGVALGDDADCYYLGNSQNALLCYGAADILEQRRTTNTQAFRIYETFTNASNYERGALIMGSDTLTIATQEAGTGTDNLNINLDPAGTGTVQIDGTNGVSGTCTAVTVVKGIVTACTP